MTRRASLPLFVVAAAVLAACVPVTQAPPPAPQPVSQYCAPTTPNSAAAYKAAFDALRKTYTEWATADGAVPVKLPGGRTLWMFGDTYVGKVSSTGVVEPGKRLVSNSAVLQTGRCFQPVLGGAPLARSAWIADPGADQGYWPASAVVDEGANRLYVMLLHVQRPGNVLGTRIARFQLSTLQLLGVTGTVSGTSTLRPYGSTAYEDPVSKLAYIYSTHDGELHVARTPVGSVTNQATWKYWTGPGDTWSAPGNHAAAQPMEFALTPDDGLPALMFTAPIAPLRVERYGEGYLGTAMLVDGFLNRMISYTAPTPFGPWTYSGDLALTPTNVVSYGAQTIFDLQGTSGPIVVHSTNLLPGQTTTISRYGFRFLEVPMPPLPTAIAAVPGTSAPPSTAPTTTTTTTTSTTTTTTSTTTTTAPNP